MSPKTVRCLACATLALGIFLSPSPARLGDSPELFFRPPGLEQRLSAALAAKGPDYRPRTEHLLPDGRPRFTNRLILEDSPYLIQHAHNPVDWYPWGPEAFERARQEGKLVLLSIGYSTCYWCHVMERESFEDLGIAALLNRHFIAIKVDREVRPGPGSGLYDRGAAALRPGRLAHDQHPDPRGGDHHRRDLLRAGGLQSPAGGGPGPVGGAPGGAAGPGQAGRRRGRPSAGHRPPGGGAGPGAGRPGGGDPGGGLR